jgi:hypothetical protein
MEKKKLSAIRHKPVKHNHLFLLKDDGLMTDCTEGHIKTAGCPL